MDSTLGSLAPNAAANSTRSAQSYLPSQSDSRSQSADNTVASAFAGATAVSLSPQSGNLLSADQIVSAINESLSSTGLSIQGVDPADYTPEAVADRILARVSDLIASTAGNDAEKARDILEKSREGIAKGIEKARDYLDNLGALNDTINNNIEDTRTRLDDGLKSLEARLNDVLSSPVDKALDTASRPDSGQQVVQSQFTQTAQASQAYAEIGTASQRSQPRYGTQGI